MLLLATLPLNKRIILSGPFSGSSSFFIACICNHYHWTKQNRLTMSLTSPVSCLSDASSSYFVSFLFDLLELISFDQFYLFDDESGNDGSGSGSPGTCSFSILL